MWWSWSKFAFVESEFRVCNQTFKICRMRKHTGIYFISRNIMHWFRSIKITVTIFYFPKSVKSVFIIVQCEQKLYCTFNNCSLCVRLNLGKSRFACTLWLSVHMKSVTEQGFFHEFAFDNKALKSFVEFLICWKHSKFERCQTRIRTSSHPYLTLCAKELQLLVSWH